MSAMGFAESRNDARRQRLVLNPLDFVALRFSKSRNNLLAVISLLIAPKSCTLKQGLWFVPLL